MYLKSIEIQGFKSFPDKTVMNFGRGVTAIVGPNGSGKSNIVDAIRWVLGEQSTKTLRGGKMEDVIFGGTARRSPLGFCEVTLSLDNADGRLPVEYAEVDVTRRYYRSGESEFYINRKSVRLKDVHELFMDTGLGRDGYSVIGQGRIDEILAVKSTDRREIFEEAAGISKFRYRKEESERKLAACDDNLTRVRDIITELETQVGPLREQAEKAKQYLVLRDELRVLEVTVWLDSLDKLKDSLQKAQTDYANAERMLSARKEELERLHEQSQQLTDEMHARDAEGERIRDEVRESEGREAQARSDAAVLRTNIQNNEDNLAAKTRELEEQTGRGESLESQRQGKRARLDELAALDTELAARLDALLGQVQTTADTARDLSARLDALQAGIALHKDRAADAQARAGALESGLQEVGARADSIGAEQAQLAQRLEQENERARALRRSVEENEEKKSSAENMLRGYDLRAQARRKKAEQLAAELEQRSRRQEVRTERLNLLRAMEREYEGFGQSVRRVMEAAHRGELRGISGPVADLIRVEDRYSVAVEIALGAALQNIVVDSEQDGKAAIGFLKSRDFGRATFLPLSAVRDRAARTDTPAGEGFCGWADALVEREGRYDRVVRSLLAGTAVVDHIDHAIALAKSQHYAFRIVTLDGQLINPSGAMTGGSIGKNVGVLSRANEIGRLQSELTGLTAQIESGKKELRAAQQELESADYEANVAREELRAAQDALLALGAERTQHQALIDTVNARMEELEREKAGQGARVAQTRSEIAVLRQTAQDHLDAAARQQAEADGLSGGRAAEEQKAGELANAVADLRVEIASARAERESTRLSVEELDALIASMADQRQDQQGVIDAIRTRNAELRAQLAAREQLAEQYAAETKGRRDKLLRVSEEKTRLEGARARCERDTQQKNNELINLERERGRLENKKTQAEMEEDSVLQKLWENYELTRVTAQEVRVELESAAKANRRIGELRAAIKKLGDVSVGSIEEYAKVSERYEFLTAQRSDLEKAKADLLKVIADLTDSMTQIFAEQFQAINAEFQVTFTEIFGGGRGRLELEDEHDVLNCGIEIKVELPGKSMRAISLLSGGEKAFVAIALYFAIIKVRPTPFCVLDEIEAALDDVNVSRFASYLHRLCDRTQFIVITHRRGTMEEADILYGVTMQEQGVTKLLALNINEVEEHIREKIQ